MGDPSKKKIDWPAIGRLNLQFLSGALAFGYGWLCWSWASPEWWGLWFIGGLCLFAGGIKLIITFFKVVWLIIEQISWRKFRDQGVAPRADSMARDSDFEQRER